MKQHFVLVHGIGGGSWCWYKIRCLMENSGCKVSCIDLKSAGIDQSDADSVLSFDDYNKPLMDFMSDLPENEQVVIWYQLYMLILVPPLPLYMSLSAPYVMWEYVIAQSGNINLNSTCISDVIWLLQVILVGHSAGGLSITQACHKFANKIRLAVYVAATMLKFGFLTDQDLKDVRESFPFH